MKHIVTLFENFSNINESWMSHIDIIRQESADEAEFKKKLEDFFKDENRQDLLNDEFIDGFVEMYFTGDQLGEKVDETNMFITAKANTNLQNVASIIMKYIDSDAIGNADDLAKLKKFCDEVSSNKE